MVEPILVTLGHIQIFLQICYLLVWWKIGFGLFKFLIIFSVTQCHGETSMAPWILDKIKISSDEVFIVSSLKWFFGEQIENVGVLFYLWVDFWFHSLSQSIFKSKKLSTWVCGWIKGSGFQFEWVATVYCYGGLSGTAFWFVSLDWFCREYVDTCGLYSVFEKDLLKSADLIDQL